MADNDSQFGTLSKRALTTAANNNKMHAHQSGHRDGFKMFMDDRAADKRPAQQTGAGKAPRRIRMVKNQRSTKLKGRAKSRQRLIRSSCDHNQRIADFRPDLG
jgi:hypothetical protein